MQAAAKLARAIDAHELENLRVERERRRADVDNAYGRGYRAARSCITTGPTRIIAAGYGSLLSAMSPALRTLLPCLPDIQSRTHVISNFTAETPAGNIHFSGGGLIFKSE